VRLKRGQVLAISNCAEEGGAAPETAAHSLKGNIHGNPSRNLGFKHVYHLVDRIDDTGGVRVTRNRGIERWIDYDAGMGRNECSQATKH
jgi:hypothetical protein